MSNITINKSTREIFIDKYVEFVCSMTHVSKIVKFDNYFYQLILFLHDGTEKYNTTTVKHKLKNNCFFVDKIFDPSIQLMSHGAEYGMYKKYIMEYCPDEIQLDWTQENTQPSHYYGCDFQCPTTFTQISNKLKSIGYTKDFILQKQSELEYSKINDSKEDYESKLKQFKQHLITTKNISTFITATNVSNTINAI